MHLIKSWKIPIPTPMRNSFLILWIGVVVFLLCPSAAHVCYSYQQCQHQLQRFAAYSCAARCDLLRRSRGVWKYPSIQRSVNH